MATNERALRCYEACGFQREGLLREDEYTNGRYQDIVAMGLLRSEWEQDARREVGRNFERMVYVVAGALMYLLFKKGWHGYH